MGFAKQERTASDYAAYYKVMMVCYKISFALCICLCLTFYLHFNTFAQKCVLFIVVMRCCENRYEV